MVADSSSEGENHEDIEVSSDDDDDSSEMESLEDEEIDDDDAQEDDEEEDYSEVESSSHNHEESVGDEEVEEENHDIDGSSSSESESDHIDINDDFNGNAPGWNEETDDYLDGGDEDDPDEIAESEGNDGWTRIDNNRGGGILEFLAGRGGIRTMSRNRDVSMPGEFLEHAAEAIGSILRDSNLEIEAFERLGLRISRVPVPGRGRQEVSAGVMNVDSARRSLETGNNDQLDRYSRGQTGPYPIVTQRSPPDMGFSSTNAVGRLVSPESTEYLYSTSMHGDTARTFYLPGSSLINPESRSATHGGQNGYAAIEGSQLFPRGRSQVPLHPLLSGANLPPPNALVPSVDHGQPAQVSQSDRDTGWSGILSSNSPGNMIPIRVNRVPVSNSTSTHTGLSAIRGWYDEPTNQGRMSANDFVEEYDRALRGMVSSLTNRVTSNEESTTSVTDVHANDEAESARLTTHGNHEQTQSSSMTHETLENRGTETTTDNLVEDLHISSDSSSNLEHSETIVADDNGEAQNDDRQDAVNDTVLSFSSNSAPGVSDNYSGPSTVQMNNSLTCPQGIDDDVFRSLPVEMQLEVIASYRSESDGLDSSENVTNPANAEDMDNASFIASLSPDLRDEILRTADETFLNTLPPAIVAEAQLLRERADSRVANITGGFIAATMMRG